MIQKIYYRGGIDFCNYACSYCPFAKKPASWLRVVQEQTNLDKLYRQIQASQDRVDLMITPYGEALVHPAYQDFICRISKLDQVNKVGIQTNLSLNIDRWLQVCQSHRADPSKMMVWATYHGDFADLAAFAGKVNNLSTALHISAGMVATLKNIDQIKELRRQLWPQVYLWLNPMAQIKHQFQAKDIRDLSQIDPMFAYEFYPYRHRETHASRPAFQTCTSYQNIYISRGRQSNRCFFKDKQAIAGDCHDHRQCDCYLGYSNFRDSKLSHFFGQNQMFRIPEKRRWKAVFIDFDGVMTDGRSKLLPDLDQILNQMAARSDLYLATARSLNSVKGALRGKFTIFRGGIFSDGALVIDRDRNWSALVAIDLPPATIGQWEESFGHRLSLDQYQGKLLRACLPSKLISGRQDPAGEKKNHLGPDRTLALKVRTYQARSYLQNQAASKQNGILKIMAGKGYRPEEVLVITDNLQDMDLVAQFPYTLAPLLATGLSERVYYSLDLRHVPMIMAE